MTPLILLWSTAALAQEVCPDRNDRLDLIDDAQQALVEADLATVDRRLRKLDEAWGCGPVADRELLGRVWLVEGAYLMLQGDQEAGADSWRAAARVAPGVWVSEFGDRLRALYEESLDQRPGIAEIVLDPPLFQYIGTVDGSPVKFPMTVEAGLHLVQIGPDLDHVEFSRSLLVFPGSPAVVQTGLLEATAPSGGGTPKPQGPVQVAELPVFEPALALYVAAGGDLTLGRSSESAAGTEPPVKLLLPVETGLVIRPERTWWLRPALMTAPVVGGRLLYEDAIGPTSTPAALGPQLAGGGHTEQGDFGALVGWQWPGRVAIRALYSGRPAKMPLRVEGRVGLNLPRGAPPEPALAVLVAFTPLIVDRAPRATTPAR